MTRVCQIHRFSHGSHEFDKTLSNLTALDTGSSIGQYFFQNKRFRAIKINSTKFWRINDFLIVYDQNNEFEKILANRRFSDRLRAKKNWIRQNFGE